MYKVVVAGNPREARGVAGLATLARGKGRYSNLEKEYIIKFTTCST